MESTCLFSAVAGHQKIDAENGIIYGVSVMTVGECAGKHAGTFIDAITLSQLVAVASKFKDGVKVKLSESKEHDGSVGQISGALKEFSVDGNNARANFYLLKTDTNYGKILEMSAKMPEAFGFSVVVPKNYTKVDGKLTLRIEDIFSIDLVEQPAANPNGLFTSKTMPNEIKYAADGKTHEKDCECKECMAKKHSSKHDASKMSEMLCNVLGLTEADDETSIKAKLAAIAKPAAPAAPPVAPEVTALTAKIDAAVTELTALKTQAETAKLSAKKGEIANLVAEATREGKVVPLTDEQLAKMDIPDIKAMLSKLTPTVKLSGSRKPEPPKDTTGKPVVFDSYDKRIQFCMEKQAEGAAQLTAQFLANPSLELTRN